jgi:NAD(P)-dependent dehydrogenase (short-subunit alcohol dehydrogenase family)
MDTRVVLITGASSGIGQACARHLARQGYRVFGTSRRPEGVTGEPFEMIPMDVTDDDSVRRGVEEVLRRAGRLDVLVNNAGFGIAGAVEDTSVEEAREQMETNFFGVLRLCRAVLPIMRAQGSGTIVIIGSLAGRIALPFQGLYSASKFALEGLSEALRMEVRPLGIQVVLIEPGDTRTNFTFRRRHTRASQDSPYAPRMQKALAVAGHDEQHGVPPESVARLLGRILRLRHPRLRYRAGSLFQKVAVSAKCFLPEALFEWAVRKYYRI